MAYFNALQIVCLYAAAPHLLAWLDTATFRGAGAAWWAALVMFLITTFFIVIAVGKFVKEEL